MARKIKICHCGSHGIRRGRGRCGSVADYGTGVLNVSRNPTSGVEHGGVRARQPWVDILGMPMTLKLKEPIGTVAVPRALERFALVAGRAQAFRPDAKPCKIPASGGGSARLRQPIDQRPASGRPRRRKYAARLSSSSSSPAEPAALAGREG